LNKGNPGKIIAWFTILMIVAGLLSPIIGVIISQYFGFQWTTIFGVLFFLIAWIPLILTKDSKIDIIYTPKKIVKDTLLNTPKILFQAEFGFSFFDGVMWVIWPLFLIIVLDGVIQTAILISISSIISIVISYFLGNVSNEKKEQEIIKIGSYTGFLINTLRPLWIEPITLSVFDSLHKISFNSAKISYEKFLYKWIEKNPIERSCIRQWIVQFNYFISVLFGALMFYFLNFDEVLIFILIFMISALTLVFMTKITKL
jgi:MFS family permease